MSVSALVKGRYGIDAPYVPLALGGCGLALAAVAFAMFAHRAAPTGFVIAAAAAFLLASTANYMYTTLHGKFHAWLSILDQVGLRGDERVLDLGCGRGAVLNLVARLLPKGRSTGIDLWSRTDQSGNDEAVTRRNAAAEGVADRIDLHTGDMRSLPFPDASFDLVVSSVAIHNIPDAPGREKAIDEAVRVLKRGGTVAIADLRHVGDYAARLRTLGMLEVNERSLGHRFWYGGPWAATRLVTAKKA